jgi:biopolymer transport protein ExbD
MDPTSDLIRRRRRQPAINIVPLVDVLTVLLFFFLVTMQFKQVSTLNITVPKIETAGENEIREQIVIALSPEGEFYLNDRLVEKPQLEAAMKLAGELTPDMPVLLIADEEVPLKFVTEVMDVCRSHQLNKIRLQSR